MQLNTAVAILTIQAIENPDEKIKCFQMIDILSKNSNGKNTDIDSIVNSMCNDLNHKQIYLSKEPDAYSFYDQFNLKNRIYQIKDLEFLQNFGISKFLSSEKKKSLPKEIANCIENSHIAICKSNINIQQSIKQFVIPKLNEYNKHLEEQRSKQISATNFTENSNKLTKTSKISINDTLTTVQKFIEAYNQTPGSIQTPTIIELNYLFFKTTETKDKNTQLNKQYLQEKTM